EGLKELAALAERAAKLCKADLVTLMVGEFPELQGVMGGYYAAAQGEDPRVAAAIRDHYKPVGQGDAVPTDPVTVAVSLADKLDTLFCFFASDEEPTGSRDPFALRRAAIATLNLLVNNNLRLRLSRAMRLLLELAGPLVDERRKHLEEVILPNLVLNISGPDDLVEIREGEPWTAFVVEVRSAGELKEHRIKQADLVIAYWSPLRLKFFAEKQGQPLLDFFADRLKVQQREAGVRHDLIDAVFALGGEDDLVRLLARVHALQAFIGTADGANLLAGYKRAANILKKEGWAASAPAQAGALGSSDNPSNVGLRPAPEHSAAAEDALPFTPEPAEASLIAALDVAEPAATAAVSAEDFEGAMAALASLRAPIDAFFETVIVNDPIPAKRTARLGLLARVRDAVHGVADFSKIEG
ncbi:MAG: glycine--tRNA ligase subunit beta, partial [Sphingomonas sp.]|uniref:glycine--tRNA ligase subunit beta n=1 Tax=Sphingomonas sp. TaxID=28214 RepID=UPI0035A8974B|nr:glycine--tRNA ligase subunit beta [Sphingomonas sp.]